MTTTTLERTVPLVDLKAQYERLEPEIGEAIGRVLKRGDFILGEELRQFEEEFAEFCTAKAAIGCANGTDALHLACRALDIGPGDEVVVPAHTFVATALGASLTGATPVLVDVDPATGLMDVGRVEEALTARTRAVIPVHLYGQCVDMDPLLQIAERRGIHVIEDAAQAHGARYKGRRAGSIGVIGCFSFYPGKNLGAYGDGGAVTVSEADLADKLRRLRNLGSERKYHHEEVALNSRLDTLQAAVLRVKLRHLEQWNAARRSLASEYDRALRGIAGLELTETAEDSVYHLYVVRVEQRDAMLRRLNKAGLQAGIHYPFAVHELDAYRGLGYPPGAFPVAERWARRCLSLPIYAELPGEAINRAASVLAEGCGRKGDAA